MCFASTGLYGIIRMAIPRPSSKKGSVSRYPGRKGLRPPPPHHPQWRLPWTQQDSLCDAANIKYSCMSHTAKFQSWDLVPGITNNREPIQGILVCIKNTLTLYSSFWKTHSAFDVCFSTVILCLLIFELNCQSLSPGKTFPQNPPDSC